MLHLSHRDCRLFYIGFIEVYSFHLFWFINGLSDVGGNYFFINIIAAINAIDETVREKL